MRLHYGGDFDFFFFFSIFFFLFSFEIYSRQTSVPTSLLACTIHLSLSPFYFTTIWNNYLHIDGQKDHGVAWEMTECVSLSRIYFLSFPFLSSFSFPLPPFPIPIPPFLFRYAHRRFFRHFTPGYAQLSFDQLRVDRIEDRTFATQNSSLARIRSRYFDSSRQRSLYIFSSRSRKFSSPSQAWTSRLVFFRRVSWIVRANSRLIVSSRKDSSFVASHRTDFSSYTFSVVRDRVQVAYRYRFEFRRSVSSLGCWSNGNVNRHRSLQKEFASVLSR